VARFRFLARLGLYLGLGLVVGLALLLGTLLVAYRFVPPVSTLMLSRTLTAEPVDRVYKPLTLISPLLVASVIASEDARFCAHDGVDWQALSEVLDKAKGREPSRGASTLTMQTAKNLFLWNSRSFLRKGIEIPLALMIDAVWPKRHILEVYLNIAEWGDGIFGAEAAAQHYFGKSAGALDRYQAALLATALPNPRHRDAGHPTGLQRRLARTIVRRAESVDTECLH